MHRVGQYSAETETPGVPPVQHMHVSACHTKYHFINAFYEHIMYVSYLKAREIPPLVPERSAPEEPLDADPSLSGADKTWRSSQPPQAEPEDEGGLRPEFTKPSKNKVYGIQT
ncbi:hypothetical protein EYF80_049486 [Liparis tanakae]|uniref:Uncharacterized protein n=1 Tax=Liparis tanakae TaxID=230148 RepID=A0A4Z2FGN4_9TELE|nr:hypothetical protein EYF80_049486 [Liparis tanakae]